MINLAEAVDDENISFLVDSVIEIIGGFVAPGVAPVGWPSGYYDFPHQTGTISVQLTATDNNTVISSTIEGVAIIGGHLVMIGDMPDSEESLIFHFNDKVEGDYRVQADDLCITQRFPDYFSSDFSSDGELLTDNELDLAHNGNVDVRKESSAILNALRTGQDVVGHIGHSSMQWQRQVAAQFQSELSGELMLLGVFDYSGITSQSPNNSAVQVLPSKLTLAIVPAEVSVFACMQTAFNRMCTGIEHELDLTRRSALFADPVAINGIEDLYTICDDMGILFKSYRDQGIDINHWLEGSPSAMHDAFGPVELVADPFVGKDIAAALEGYDTMHEAVQAVAAESGMRFMAVAMNCSTSHELVFDPHDLEPIF